MRRNPKFIFYIFIILNLFIELYVLYYLSEYYKFKNDFLPKNKI